MESQNHLWIQSFDIFVILKYAKYSKFKHTLPKHSLLPNNILIFILIFLEDQGRPEHLNILIFICIEYYYLLMPSIFTATYQYINDHFIS